jgi:hypothetical protein
MQESRASRVRGNRFYSELVAGDTSLIEAYNGKSAWHGTANGEFATLVGAPRRR